ncbi:hypothetical protein BD626DRAFT_49374 [Schizophyllum amplum]|uniref:Uncharacterized protein n=1 Tax=Schizophyllum amplum TaxID=97359 RepID=A0A550CCD8_9AGAR|nr:hypothetical protein BD626DRAFT_49374 [Auriculariopsis ampla]
MIMSIPRKQTLEPGCSSLNGLMARGCSIACLVRPSHLLLPIHSPNLPHHLMISISNLRPTPASASTRVSVSNPSLWRVWRRQHGYGPSAPHQRACFEGVEAAHSESPRTLVREHLPHLICC